MSDLRERYSNSPSLHELTAEQQELEADRKKAAETPSAREAFAAAHPELGALQREPVLSSNKAAVVEKVKAFRLENLKSAFTSQAQEHDLSEEEQKFAAEVLALRVAGAGGSVRALIDDLHIDFAADFGRAVVDARELRAMKAKHDAHRARYKTMGDFTVTPTSFLSRGM